MSGTPCSTDRISDGLPGPTDRVVAAVAIVRDGRVLAGRRVGPPAVRGGWEFPGGSVEPGETAAQAAVREAREELGVDVVLTGVLGDARIGPGRMLTVFTAALTSGEPAATGSHDRLQWVSGEHLHELDWLAPDRPLLAPLAALLTMAPPAATNRTPPCARCDVAPPEVPGSRPDRYHDGPG